MGLSIAAAMKRASAILLLFGVIMAAAAAPSRAGSYDVLSCADAPSAVNHSWTISDVAPGKLQTGDECGGYGSYAGLYVRDVLGVANAAAGDSAHWTFNAPPGTAITALQYSRWLYKEDDDDWQSELRADTTIDACTIPATAISCTSGLEGGARTGTKFIGASSLVFGVRCGATAPTTCVNGGTLHKAVAVLYGATVTLSDSSAPALSAVGGSLVDGGYRRGPQGVGFTASDNAGIRSARLYADGRPVVDTTYSCDFTYAVPCSNLSGAQLAIDTRSLVDGSHSVVIAASDPAGNEVRSAAQTVTVDNGAPAAPQGISVDGGPDWRAANSFSVSWMNPGSQVAPIAAANYQVCRSDGSNCQPQGRLAGQDLSRIDGVAVPSTGEWSMRVWLEDAAGNSDPAHAAVATLRYGSAPQPSPDPSASTVPLTSDPASGGSSPLDLLTAPLAAQTTTARANAHLRLTSARLSHGRILIRGRIARAARGRLALTVRLKHGPTLRRTVTLRGGRFVASVRSRPRTTFGGSVLARFAGSASLLPARAVLRFRR